MRDYILIYVNGQRLEVKAADAFATLSNFLRYELSKTGTKVVCEEGDCGACTVLLGNIDTSGELAYKPVNSCIQLMCQLDLAHVVTIEGLTPSPALNPVQAAMVECHGAQCGFCTPGFVVAMCALFDQPKPVAEQDIKDGLTGNLCRCTGYEPIIKAGLSVDQSKVSKLAALYPGQAMVADLKKHAQEAVSISYARRQLCIPLSLEEAARFKSKHQGVTVLAGGTDVCVVLNKRGLEPDNILVLNRINGIGEITAHDDKLVVGALATLHQLEDEVENRLPELHHMMWLFGSPQIRHAATLAGNIANGSPIADTLPFLFVMEAEVELVGSKGRRLVNIDHFYKGYKQLDMAADELIGRIHVPLPKPGDLLKLYKVSRRRNLDISTFTAAIYLRHQGGSIYGVRIAYGGVGPVVLRLPKTEKFLEGKAFEWKTFAEAGDMAGQEITPISDVRGSKDFRYQLAANIMQKFYFEVTAQMQEATCP
jgi:xanthine dehydrogenase small subunit